MKKILYYILPILAVLFVGCSDQDDFFNGEGSVRFDVNLNNGVKVIRQSSRAGLTDEEQNQLRATSRVRLYNSDNKLIQKYEDLATVPELIKLVTGNYMISVEAGKSTAASFEDKFFQGENEFSVTRAQTKEVAVVCNIMNTLVTVTFDQSLYDAFTENLKVTLSTSKGQLQFTPENANQTGYFILPDDAVINCKFEGVKMDGQPFIKETQIENAKATTRYDLSYKFTATSTETGGAAFDLEVDETPLHEESSQIIIYERPKLSVLDADNEDLNIDSPVFFEPNSDKSFSIWAVTSCPLTRMQLSSSSFISWGIPLSNINLSELTATEINSLNEVGLTISKRNGLNGSVWGVTFSTDLVTKITTNEGSYTISVTVGDSEQGVTSKDLVITVSDATIVAVEVNDASVWSNKATLQASVVKTLSGTPSFRYRKVGTATWTNIAGTVDGANVKADLTGLEAGTRYEYQALDGEVVSANVCTFTTESASQPENAGFEYWSGSTPLLMYASGQNMWWDTGNHGSATMSKNVTNSSTEYVHSGVYSAKLSSQFVGISIIGKFAAGNAFVGQYLKTDGTDGILGWGRPFYSRPKSLKGYVRYQPAAVKYANVPAEVAEFPEGSTDIGTVFIALGDWAGENYDGTTWPLIIKTKESTRQLFDPNGSGVIAYGAIEWREAVGGDGMIEFEIPLEYRSLERKPTAIVIVASASKYGDYFSGGDSTMWIDDFELIYE